MDVQPVLAALVVTSGCLWLLLSPLGRRRLLDQPNERSLHARPVPRSGGIAIAAGVAAGIAASGAQGLPLPALGIAGALSAVSLADDLVGLPTLLRLATHLAAAAAMIAMSVGFAEPWTAVLLLVGIAWYANLYNFMDGADGLAGGMAVIGFGAYAWAAHQAAQPGIAAASLVVACASAAFLAVNFHPARLFMGDVGSVPLGFLAGALGILGWREAAWPLWFPMLVFAPFACDATLTLLKRVARRERVWEAHKEHYYQRLVRMEFGHRGTAWIEYAAMAGCAAVALAARDAAPVQQAGALAGATVVLVAVAAWIDARWARFRQGSGGVAR